MTEAWLACVEAVVRFTWHFDDGDVEGAVGLFAADGVWQRIDGDVVGHDGLRRLLNSRGNVLARHVLSNHRVSASGTGGVLVESYVTAYRAMESSRPARLKRPYLVGRYHDVLVSTAGRWQIQHRALQVDFKASPA